MPLAVGDAANPMGAGGAAFSIRYACEVDVEPPASSVATARTVYEPSVTVDESQLRVALHAVGSPPVDVACPDPIVAELPFALSRYQVTLAVPVPLRPSSRSCVV